MKLNKYWKLEVPSRQEPGNWEKPLQVRKLYSRADLGCVLNLDPYAKRYHMNREYYKKISTPTQERLIREESTKHKSPFFFCGCVGVVVEALSPSARYERWAGVSLVA